MKINHFILLFLFSSGLFFGQTETKKTEERYFFKDTIMTFNGLKIEFIKSFATKRKLKIVLNVTNPDNKYYILDPLDVFANIIGSEIKIRDSKHKKVIVNASSSQKIILEFKGMDYRVQSVNLNFSKFNVSGDAISTYTFSDMPITEKNLCKSGPLTWILTHKDYDVNTGIRLKGKLKYTGNNLLVINLDNAILKTGDRHVYNHIGEPGFISRNNKYYDFKHNFELEYLYFPAKRKVLHKDDGIMLNLTGAFTEYTMLTIEGFNINLRKGN